MDDHLNKKFKYNGSDNPLYVISFFDYLSEKYE